MVERRQKVEQFREENKQLKRKLKRREPALLAKEVEDNETEITIKIATRNVGPVIKVVAKLCGKNVKNIPSRQVVDTFVDRKLAITQKHVGTAAAASSNTTLYSDETRKHGYTYETYIISDDKQNSYILGLREMANKSGASTAETLQQIIQDISVYCTQSDNLGLGYDLLTNIKNTMSDRASTEKTFNGMFDKVIDNYDQLSEDEKNLCGQMNNFFCGLHLLVTIADVCETSTSKFENNYESGDLGSASDPHLTRKVCAVGEDERNGASKQWKTYLQTKNDKNRIKRFNHNRYNIMFMEGSALFYHSADIADFPDNVHGASNDALKAVSLDIKEDLYLAGAKAHGLISKFSLSPLWRFIEAPGHILDMKTTFNTHINFLERAASDQSMTEHFITGEVSPFETEVNEKDVVMKKLIENHRVDEIVMPLMQNIFIAIKQLLQRMIPEHLQGGKCWEPSDELRKTTKSAKKQ
ncbi:hypothetical protein MAR_025533 [Mya arenaria]|uniref:Uncharacterized protein n=1 Tax=Mya arenaria TaxID=6604 RepID=A0ABY7EMY8_MYAAR|nr:hypothetical protein MAR_025533 [Mya arenaria]